MGLKIFENCCERPIWGLTQLGRGEAGGVETGALHENQAVGGLGVGEAIRFDGVADLGAVFGWQGGQKDHDSRSSGLTTGLGAAAAGAPSPRPSPGSRTKAQGRSGRTSIQPRWVSDRAP